MSSVRVADISEFDLIERLRQALPETAREGDRVPLAIGDDAAVARLTPGEQLVISTDTLNDVAHFRLDWTSWTDLGHKALAVNLSDLAAMGAKPVLATVNLGLTGRERVADLVTMYRSLGSLAVSYETIVAGGDITRSPAGLSITVTVIGETVSGAVMRRDSGQAGDSIWVTGMIGAAAAGLRLLEMDVDDPRRRAATAGVLIQALHRPDPRVSMGMPLAAAGVRCAMDLSDGLAGDLHKIMDASGVDAELDLDRLPVPGAVLSLFRDEAIQMAISGGDDYELLFAAPPSLAPAITDVAGEVGVPVTEIGRLTDRWGPTAQLTGTWPDGTRTTIQSGGFDHFRHT